MKKVIISFYCDKNSMEDGWLKKFDLVEDVISEIKTIKATVYCVDGVTRILDYSISEFEYTWKINLAELF